MASEPEPLVSRLRDLNGSIAAIGLQARPLSQWLHRCLGEAGLNVVLVESRPVKGALKAMPIKTDRRDAEGIARPLHLGWFRPVHCKSISAQKLRAVLGTRKAIQQTMIALEMSLRELLRNFGLKVGAIFRGRVRAPHPRTGKGQYHAGDLERLPCCERGLLFVRSLPSSRRKSAG